MKTAIGVGIVVLIVIAAMSVVAWDISMAMKLSGYAGLGSLALAALFSGAVIDPDSRRADMATEGRESRDRRFNLSTFFLLVALPNLLACLILYFGSK
ncbi:hypothetical protein ABD76_03500 [Paenibacillus dendritiformis]|uniref:DUF5316 domain-containing protein n=1 Tax=Paenibacillus dendritiformis TaxID=130049 RepID=UPI0018CE4F1C|nr:DUF5316 domain-containing protein [Paenibacillus dendritiformis]MBG9791626.1 hypothetical protein [Paenibacillus dendritiformis]